MSPTPMWLPAEPDIDARFAALKEMRDVGAASNAWREVEALARMRLDFTQTGRLDRVAQRLPDPSRLASVRVSLLTSCTAQHLLPSLRIAGLRRGLRLEIYINAYGQYFQELLDVNSALHRFRPEVCCLVLDARHLVDLAQDGCDTALDRMSTCWRLCREHFSASVVQQTALPVFEAVIGSNEHRLAGSPAARSQQVNERIRDAADEAGVALLDANALAAMYGIDALHDPALWHLAKQEIHPAAAPVWGDHLARAVAALRGRSAKCLVLDLDNTLWGGIVGDDGVDGLQLGQGHAMGEAYLEFQRYCLALKGRGIALAVCSKNDEANARAPFREHPAMLLRERDIACFVANWQDKATNLRTIARALNLGLDALVFVDDNPAERALVRQELPEVAVPEMPEDPADFVRCLARAGYFEAVCCTPEDFERAERYRANAEREVVRETATDLHSYLVSLEMQAHWSPFSENGLARIVQLINKTNQFNLTTPRVSEADVRGWMTDPCMKTWQVRLTDRFGDNGIVALMAARVCGEECALTMLLMSCRVLGRRLEEELFNLLGATARAAGAARIAGIYRPTPKNGMTRDLLQRFGFEHLADNADGSVSWSFPISRFSPRQTEIQVDNPGHRVA
ncbi:MAG: HAD-IIIC family phosphatase [Acidobacteriaceae bacterium]